VTENGLAWKEDNVTVAVNDVQRQQYLHDHIEAVGEALQAGADVKGYFVWSFQVSYLLFCLNEVSKIKF
jgi:beta-glucosidase